MIFAPLQRLSIKWKLILVITLVATVISASEIALFIYFDAQTYTELRRSRIHTIAEVVGLNCAPALKFRDRKDAQEVLQSLHAEASLRSAYLFSDEGALLAEYLREGEELSVPMLVPGAEGEKFTNDDYELTHRIVLNGQSIGTLYLLSDLADFRQRARTRLLLGGTLGLMFFVLSALLALWLQRIFTKRMKALGNTIAQVTQHKDYSVRAQVSAHDEIGVVVDGFNQMLGEIESRDRTLEESNKELDKRVIERTAELESINKELESFSYSVSHDLRAPLRSIQGFAQILATDYREALDSEARRFLDIITTDVQKMGCLIDDLLAFSRMSRQQMNTTKINMRELAQKTFDELKSKIPNRKVQFSVGDLPPAVGDPSMIRQVIFNLLSNALKFTAKKDAAVVEVAAKVQNGQNIYTVKDNGVGFDSRYRNKLFGVFQRLHSEEEFEGTGVGLAIVARVVQRHGGTVDAESVLNQGTTFYFSLPSIANIEGGALS